MDGGLPILQYADDTVLFMDHDVERRQKFETLAMRF